ncbi:hypothetical protein SNEBB_008996 [Seison nebaliae]|nr:hypothetical protein SNEBB_008996 [Seison nebaliae]
MRTAIPPHYNASRFAVQYFLDRKMCGLVVWTTFGVGIRVRRSFVQRKESNRFAVGSVNDVSMNSTGLYLAITQ